LAQDADFVGVHLQQVPALPPAVSPTPKAPPADDSGIGLGLHAMFLNGGSRRVGP